LITYFTNNHEKNVTGEGDVMKNNAMKIPMLIRSFFLTLLLLWAAPSVPAEAVVSLTLQDAIREALERNPSAGMERQKLLQLEADYRVARAGLLPHLSANASYSRIAPDRLAMSAPTGVALYEREAYSGIGLSQLLFDGKTNAIRKAAATAASAQGAQVASAENLAVYQASKAFIQVLESRALLQAAEQAVQRARSFQEMTGAYFDAGKVTRLDLLHARSGRIEAEAALVRAQELGQTGMALLAAVIGRELLDFTVDGRLPAAVLLVPQDSMTLEAAMANNPDVQRTQKLGDRADYAADAARGARYPLIIAKAGWGYRDRDIGGGAREWTAGLQLDLPIYDGGALRAGIAKADAAVAESREAERSARLAVQSQLRRELSAWRMAAADIHSAEEAVAAARESLDAAEALYRAGKATALDILTAQLNLSRGETERASALAGYAIAQAGVELLVGATRSFTLNSKGGSH
jgi:outer membrane protein